MKIYFAGAIRAGRDDADVYLQIIEYLKRFGDVLTEHVGDSNLMASGEAGQTDTFIHDRDTDWLLQSDAVVAEVTTPSLGVGYEIARAIEHGKRVLCLYRPGKGKKLSAMISGCAELTLKNYIDPEAAAKIVDAFFSD